MELFTHRNKRSDALRQYHRTPETTFHNGSFDLFRIFAKLFFATNANTNQLSFQLFMFWENHIWGGLHIWGGELNIWGGYWEGVLIKTQEMAKITPKDNKPAKKYGMRLLRSASPRMDLERRK